MSEDVGTYTSPSMGVVATNALVHKIVLELCFLAICLL